MSALNTTLTAFGRNLGLSDFEWPLALGVAAFAFENRGTLHIEARGDALLMYMIKQLNPHQITAQLLANALRLCHYRHQWQYTVQVALYAETQLVFLVRLPQAQATLPELEQALALLTNLHQLCVT